MKVSVVHGGRCAGGTVGGGVGGKPNLGAFTPSRTVVLAGLLVETEVEPHSLGEDTSDRDRRQDRHLICIAGRPSANLAAAS